MSEAEAAQNESESEQPPKKRPIGLIVIACVLIAGAFFGIRMYLYNAGHVATDDAYITTDVVPVNALVSGNIVTVQAKENRDVKQGDLLVQLDDTTYKADVDQALANLAVAQANARSASADLNLTAQTGNAQVSEAQGGVQVGGSDIATAESNVLKAISGVATARATYDSAMAQAKAADQGVQTAISDRERLVSQLKSAQSGIVNAEASVKVAQANLANAEATEKNAEHDAQRYRSLANEGAVPVSEAEQRETISANSMAAVDAAKQQVAAARAAANQRRADFAAAEQQVKSADSAIATAKAQARAAHQVAAAQATRISQADSDVNVARQGVNGAQARQQQNVGKLQEAQALPKRLSISEAAKQQALAKVRQAQAALESAQIALARTQIRASVTGRVTRKAAEIGQQVAPGQPLMSLIPVETPWIIANFKETQLAGVRPGQVVEIDVDALPDHPFKGHVDSISPGTGSTFALLPADNATGNFTKVVQRVPVKITLDPGQADLDKLGAGLSVSVAIAVK
jgi:membrane fusion protein, multidrug efflux system